MSRWIARPAIGLFERKGAMVLHFDSDYMEGAHPKILERLGQINLEKNPGYGSDSYCESAKAKIREACDCPDAQIWFLVGGTQTNSTVLDALLHTYDGVIAADSGHINGHEAGAVETTGHKVLALPHQNGKITASLVSDYLNDFYQNATYEHMVQPGAVYISHPTEYGTLYTKAELEALRHICDHYEIPLYLDGARLGYGLMAQGTDVTLVDISRNADAFYIGGTKVGAFFGEAVVMPNPKLVSHFFTTMKNHGALMAKGWLPGVQFDTLFTNGLYYEISQNAVDMAEKLKKGFLEKGYSLAIDSPTNQQFFVLDADKVATLKERVTFEIWERIDSERVVARFVTSWATQSQEVEDLLALL